MEELEIALKESLNITAEREEVLAREEERRQKLEKHVSSWAHRRRSIDECDIKNFQEAKYFWKCGAIYYPCNSLN